MMSSSLPTLFVAAAGALPEPPPESRSLPATSESRFLNCPAGKPAGPVPTVETESSRVIRFTLKPESP